jgi:hypothetical protein
MEARFSARRPTAVTPIARRATAHLPISRQRRRPVQAAIAKKPAPRRKGTIGASVVTSRTAVNGAPKRSANRVTPVNRRRRMLRCQADVRLAIVRTDRRGSRRRQDARVVMLGRPCRPSTPRVDTATARVATRRTDRRARIARRARPAATRIGAPISPKRRLAPAATSSRNSCFRRVFLRFSARALRFATTLRLERAQAVRGHVRCTTGANHRKGDPR